MKKVKFTKYWSHAELTDGEQRIPDEVVVCSDAVASILVSTNHAVYVEEPKKAKPKPVKMTEKKIEIVED